VALLARCDNQTCNKDIPEGAEYFELQREAPYATLSTDTTPKQFCCLGCVSEYAGRACGWTGGN
jgi:hypothetical protein